jgi:hypothetical protein
VGIQRKQSISWPEAAISLCWLLRTSVRKIGSLYMTDQVFLPKHVRCEYNQRDPFCSYSLATCLFHEGEGQFVPYIFVSIKQRVYFSFHVCKIRGKDGSVSLYVNGSRAKEHALAEQIEVRTSIHLPLDALELIHFALRLCVAVFRCQSRSDRIIVPVDPGNKAFEWRRCHMSALL